MLDMQQRRGFPLLAVLAVVLGLGACGRADPTGAPTHPDVADPSPALTLVPGAASPSGPPTTTETDWGTIVDRLPAGFPRYPEAVEVDPSDGPASGAFVVGASGRDVTEWYQGALELAGYSTVALSGPFEDGTTIIDSVGPESTACRVQTTITPRSGTTLVTVLYDAACES